MPIRKQDYPPDWDEISLQVKEDAGWLCEWCGVAHDSIIRRTGDAEWIEVKQVYNPDSINFLLRDPGEYEPTASMTWARLRFHGLTRIILATAHLDRNTKNNARSNLAALCQRCHLRHDILQHITNRRYGRHHAKAPQTKLFE